MPDTEPLPDIENDTRDPAVIWSEYFSRHTPRPPAVADAVLKLHNARKHEHVIAAVQQAIIHGQGQPWMYDTLALSMKIAGRPDADVERVLLSSVDFTAADVPAMISSAAVLQRFGGSKQSLHLYRQASRLEPARPEPYALGLKTAMELKDPDAIAWAATGVLTYVWTADHDQLRLTAEKAALDAADLLRRAGRNQELRDLEAAMAKARQRDLHVRLDWNGDGDLDLMIEEPLGTLCSFENPRTRGGGILVHDGFGPQQKNCFDEYVCPLAISGTYRISIRYVSGNIVGQRAVLTVVRYQGTPDETSQKIPIVLAEQDRVVTVELQRGRREKLLSAVPAARLPALENRALADRAPAAGQFPEGRLPRRLAQRRGRRVYPPGTGFVTGAVGIQPIVTLVNEGATLEAGAVISADRRYVRISVRPSFNTITDVLTFSFLSAP